MSASGLERHMLKLPVSLQRTDGPPWAMGNKQRGLTQFRFHPSGIVAPRRPVWVIQAREAELKEAGRGSPLSGTARPVDGQGGVIGA